MIKGNCTQSVAPRHGKQLNFGGALKMPILINRTDVVTLLKFYRRFIKMRLF